MHAVIRCLAPAALAYALVFHCGHAADTLAAKVTVTEEQRKAVLAAGRLIEWQRAVATACRGHLAEGGDAALPFFTYFWQVDELKRTLMKNLIWPALDEGEKAAALTYAQTVQSKLTAATETARLNSCNALVSSFVTPASHLDSRSPEDAKLLDAMFDTHPELLSQWHKDNFTAGCVKANFNVGGRVFDKAKSICDCQTNAVLAHASPAELAEWLSRSANEKRPLDLKSKPWYQRAQPAIEACWINAAAAGR